MSAALSKMRGGELIDLLNPDWRLIDVGHLAAGLAGLRRFCNAAPLPLSVAEHSLAVAREVAPERELAALLHDAHEAVTGDITRPMRAALEADAVPAVAEILRDGFHRIEEGLDHAIAKAVLYEAGCDPVRLSFLAGVLAAEMRAPDVRRADDAACERELAGLWSADVFRPAAANEAAMAAQWAAKVRDAALVFVAREVAR